MKISLFMNASATNEKTATTHLFPSTSLDVKMFVHNNPEEAENAISQWLQQNNVIIRHATQSQSEKNGKFVFIITLFFHRNSERI